MKFSHEYRKLKNNVFHTIRQDTGYYQIGQKVRVETPEQEFYALITEIKKITKVKISDELAMADADCSGMALIKLLENWYGKEYDNFILIYMKKLNIINEQLALPGIQQSRPKPKRSKI